MTRCLTYIVFFMCLHNAYSQPYLIKGTVLDSLSISPIYNAHIKIKNSSYGTVSDEQGTFVVSTSQKTITLEITHVAYKKRTITLEHPYKKVVTLFLQRQIDSLPEVVVKPSRVVNLVERRLYDVVDYEFWGDTIVLLTYSWRDKINPWFILMNLEGDTIFKTPAIRDGQLYKDCLGNIHLITKHTAYQLYFDNRKLYYLYPMKADTFKKILEPCITTINDTFYIQQYTNHHQVLSYYIASKEGHEIMRVISDAKVIRMLEDRQRFYSMGVKTPSDADIRFEEMCFFKPLFAPLIKTPYGLLLFNFVENKLEHYNFAGKQINTVPIQFHKHKFWKAEIIADAVNGSVFAVFKKNGKTTLKQIDITTGELTNEYAIPDFKYVEKIKAHNNRIYFLYRKNDPYALTELYRMDL